MNDGISKVAAALAAANLRQREYFYAEINSPERRNAIAILRESPDLPGGLSEIEAWAWLGLRLLDSRMPKKRGRKAGKLIEYPNDESLVDQIEAMMSAGLPLRKAISQTVKQAINAGRLDKRPERTTHPKRLKRAWEKRQKVREADEAKRKATRDELAAMLMDAKRDINSR